MPLLVRVKDRYDRPRPTGSYYRPDATATFTSPTAEGNDVAENTTDPTASTITQTGGEA